jgi:hypothetical protein
LFTIGFEAGICWVESRTKLKEGVDVGEVVGVWVIVGVGVTVGLSVFVGFRAGGTAAGAWLGGSFGCAAAGGWTGGAATGGAATGAAGGAVGSGVWLGTVVAVGVLTAIAVDGFSCSAASTKRLEARSLFKYWAAEAALDADPDTVTPKPDWLIVFTATPGGASPIAWNTSPIFGGNQIQIDELWSAATGRRGRAKEHVRSLWLASSVSDSHQDCR